MAINLRLSNIPPITKATVISTFLLSLLCAAFRYRLYMSQSLTSTEQITNEQLVVPFLTVVPATSYLFPWTFFTASFVQLNIFSLALALVVLLYAGRYLERAWPSKEYAKFILVCTVIPNLLAFAACVLIYYFFGYDSFLYMNISGLAGLQCAYLIAFKQLVPEHTVTLFRSPLKIRVKHFPGLYLFLAAWSAPFLGTYASSLLAHIAFLTSWIYLRFYKLNTLDTLPTTAGQTTSTTIRGDASETFSFASFFPDKLQPPITSCTTVIFNLFVKLGLCRPWSQGDVELSNARAEHREGGASYQLGQRPAAAAPGSARAEAERRRALALKALDQRLHAANLGKSSSPAPAVAPMVATINSVEDATQNHVEKEEKE